MIKIIFNGNKVNKESVKEKKEPEKSKPKSKPVVEQPPQKKKGRPTNEEVAARKKAEALKEDKVKQEIIQKQQEIVELNLPTSSSVPDYPIFRNGERVRLIEKVLTSKDAERINGIVDYHKITSAFVHVLWDNGYSDFRHAKVLEKIIC